MPKTITPLAGSLRERKKLKTRESIQREAMRLIQKQGYDKTTIEQIAHSARGDAPDSKAGLRQDDY